jgi:hypothetical protein
MKIGIRTFKSLKNSNVLIEADSNEDIKQNARAKRPALYALENID